MPNNNKLQQIYNAIKSEGDFQTTKSYGQFVSRMQHPDYHKHIFNFLRSKGVDTGDYAHYTAATGRPTQGNLVQPKAKTPWMQPLQSNTIPSSIAKPVDYAKPGALVANAKKQQDNSYASVRHQQGLPIGKYTEEDVNDVNDRIANRQLDSLQKYADNTMKENTQSLQAKEDARPWWATFVPAAAGGVNGNDVVTEQRTKKTPERNNIDTAYAIQNKVKDAREVLNEAKTQRKEDKEATGIVGKTFNKVKRAGRGLVNAATDIRTWDNNFTDLNNSSTLQAASKAYESGTATDEQKQLLNTAALNTKVESERGDAVGGMYGAGKTTTQMLPFMAQMALNPADGFGKFVGKEAAGALTEKLGKSLTDRVIGKAVLTAGKAGARVAGDVAEGGVAAFTFGAPGILADTKERMTGTPLPAKDQNGNVVYSGHDDGAEKDETKAFTKAATNQLIQYQTELAGEYFEPIGQFAKGVVGKGLSKLGLGKVGNAITTLSNKNFAKSFDDFAKKTKWNGTLGEYGEEVLGNVENAATVGDMNFNNPDDPNSVFNKKTNIDTFLGVALGAGFMSALKTGDWVRNKHRISKALTDVDNEAVSTFGDDWQDMRQNINSADDKSIVDVLSQSAKGKTPEQVAVLKKYAALTYANRGANLAEMKDDAEGNNPTERDKAFDDGYNITEPQQMTDAKYDLDAKREKAKKALGADDTIDDIIGSNDAMLKRVESSGKYTPEQVSSVKDYVNSRAKYEGMIAKAKDDIDSKVKYTSNLINSHTHTDGMIHPAVLKSDDNRQVYIVNGSIVRSDSGNYINNTKSDDAIVVVDAQTGKKAMVDSSEIQSIDEPLDAEQERNKAIEAVRNNYSVSLAKQIDGILPCNPGDNYKLQDEKGQQLNVNVLSRNEDNTITAVVNNDTEHPVSIPIEKLQKVQDAMNMQRVQQHNDYQQEQKEPQSLAVNGEIAFNDENGNEMKGTIVDMINEGEEDEKFVVAQQDGTTVEVSPNNIIHQQSEEGRQQPHEQSSNEMPIREGGEPDYYSVEPKRSHSYIYNESGLPRDVANTLVDNNKAEADRLLDKITKSQPKIGTSIAKYKQQMQEWRNKVDEAQKASDYWNAVKEEQRKVQNAEQSEHAEKQAAETSKAIEQEKQRKEAEAAKVAEQEKIGTNNAAPSIKEKWDKATKIDGASNEIVLANGETIKGHYVLAESGAATPSHNVDKGFANSEGFPVDENGQNVNSRDYEKDSAIQQQTYSRAADYDSRAIQKPVVVSKEGVVLSGNGRTMSGEIAARDNTDKKYIDHLNKYSMHYGFTPEQVSSMKHPRLLFVPDDNIPYTAVEFHKFNGKDENESSKSEQSVTLGKVVDDPTYNRILRSINKYDTISDFYADNKATADVVKELVSTGAISSTEVAKMIDGDGISEIGKELLENVLIGKAFESNPDAVRQITAYKAVRKSIISALTEIGNNKLLGDDFTLEKELSDAIALVYKARNAGIKQGDRASVYARQGNLFQLDDGSTVADYTNSTVMMLADVLNDNGVTKLKKILSIYNAQAKESAAGQLDMFSGSVNSKKDIIKDVLKLINYGTEQEQQSAIAQSVEQRKAEAEAESVQQDEPSDKVDKGSESEQVEKVQPIDNTTDEEHELLKRVKVLDDDSEKETENGTEYTRTIVVDGNHNIEEINAPDENGYYTGAYYNYDGTRFASIKDAIEYIDKKDRDKTKLGEKDSKEASNVKETSYGSKYPVGSIERSNEERMSDIEEQISAIESRRMEIDDMFNESNESPENESLRSEDEQLVDKLSELESEYNGLQQIQSRSEEIAKAESEVDTNPTDAQKEAGNYKKGHVQIGTFDVTIENPKGSFRSGKDENGKEWKTEMHNTYGYFRGTEGVDGDHIDVFLSDNIDGWNGRKVFVVDQYNTDGTFDEHKVMLGFNDIDDAERAYYENYSSDWKEKHPNNKITEVNLDDFEKWIESSHRKTKAFSEYSKFAKPTELEEATKKLKDVFADKKIPEKKTETEKEKVAKPKTETRVDDSNHKLVSTVRYEELKKRMRDKLNNLNIGIDPEMIAIGTEMAVYHIEGGARKFAEYSKAMIADLGDKIRPYLKGYYENIRRMPEAIEEGLSDDMDNADYVEKFDVANFDKKTINALDTADEVVEEQKANKKVKEGKEKKYAEIDASVDAANDVQTSDDDEEENDTKYRISDEFEDGEVLPIEQTNYGYTVDGINNTFDTKTKLLDAFRNKYPNYIANETDNGIKVESWKNMQEDRSITSREEKAKAGYVSRKTERAKEHIRDVASKLGLNDVNIVEDTDELDGKKKNAKGWYDTRTGKITVVIPNHSDLGDLTMTLLHEGVAHHGLRKMLGDKFNDFLDSIYENASEDIRKKIAMNAAKRNWDFRTTTEEYLASLAEDTDFKHAMKSGWWKKIKKAALYVLNSIGLHLDDKLTDNELRYLLWRSYNNLINSKKTLFDVADDVDMQNNLKVGNYAERKDDKVAEDNTLFRDGNDEENDTPIEVKLRAKVRDSYERRLVTSAYQLTEAFQDSMLGLKTLMNEIDKATGHKTADFENAYMFENKMSSINHAEAEAYNSLVMEPLVKVVAGIVKSGATENEVKDYMIAKHGLERNTYMANRDAEKAFEKYQVENPDGEKTLDDFVNEYRNKDYSGLTALTGENNIIDAEAKAQEMVDAFENKYYQTKQLWKNVNACTKATLSKLYEGGLMNKDTYEKVKGMYKYYIPLRGFNEPTTDEIYGYLNNRDGAFGQNIMKSAEGRKTKADDPIATIASMAESAISQGNRNRMKQRFLNYVLNNPSDAVSVNKLWLKHNDANDTWNPVFPELNDDDTAEQVEKKVQDFENKMNELSKENPDIYKGADKIDVPYILKKDNLKEHQVLVKRNGKTYVLTINGNPRAAQALNGITNPDVDIKGAVGKALNLIGYATRQMSAFYTTRNPNFVASNFVRDALYANSMVWLKETPNYALKYNQNFMRYNPVNIKLLLSKFENGELNQDDKTEKMFHSFMMNGGETGYTIQKDLDRQKKEIEKKINSYTSKVPLRLAMKCLGQKLDDYNRAVENCARFACFVTSREMGRSVDRSVYDAKEITVNFNKKGSGDKFLDAKGMTKIGRTAAFISGTGRQSFIFWNAAIQGTYNVGKIIHDHPKKGAVALASLFLLGALIPSLNGNGGGDDDKNYYNLPDYIRRSNICIRVGNKWITIPLSVEMRAMYGLGELATSTVTGNEKQSVGNVSLKVAEQLSQILPLDFMEGDGATAFVPSAVKPVAEILKNKDWTGLPIYKENEFNKNMPAWTKVYNKTNKTLVNLSRLCNEVTGGDKYARGWLNWNPAIVEHLFEGIFGGAATTFVQLANCIDDARGTKDFDWRDIPIASRLVKSADERAKFRNINERYFNYLDEYKETQLLIGGYSKETTLGISGYAKKLDFLYNSPEYSRYQIIQAYDPAFNSVNSELKALKDAEVDDNDSAVTDLKHTQFELRADLVKQLDAVSNK